MAGATLSNLRQETQRWAVSLSIMYSSGHELNRLRPDLQQTGRPEDWTRSCQESNCVWQGHNAYGFKLSQLTAVDRAAVQGGRQVQVMIDLLESASPNGPVASLPSTPAN